MPELGSIYDAPSEGATPGSGAQGKPKARGRDIMVKIQVPEHALGVPDGHLVTIPLEVELEGQRVRRVPSPHDRGDQVLLRLPRHLTSGSVIKLREQGGPSTESGAPGDLFVEIEIVEVPLPIWVYVAAATAAATLLAWLTR